MKNGVIFLFLAMIIAGIFAFSGSWAQYPFYADSYTVTASEFANFLFWMFLFLFLLALVLSPMPRQRSGSALKKTETESGYILTSGFLMALFFFLISFVAAIFGLGFMASTFAGLAMILFWIAIILALVALVIGFFEQRGRRNH